MFDTLSRVVDHDDDTLFIGLVVVVVVVVIVMADVVIVVEDGLVVTNVVAVGVAVVDEDDDDDVISDDDDDSSTRCSTVAIFRLRVYVDFICEYTHAHTRTTKSAGNNVCRSMHTQCRKPRCVTVIAPIIDADECVLAKIT